jgi:hypothetical protein
LDRHVVTAEADERNDVLLEFDIAVFVHRNHFGRAQVDAGVFNVVTVAHNDRQADAMGEWGGWLG